MNINAPNVSMNLKVIQRFSDDPLKKCPECNKNSLNKLISALRLD